MSSVANLTNEEKRLLNDYDPALHEVGLAAKLQAIIDAVNDLETRLAAVEAI